MCVILLRAAMERGTGEGVERDDETKERCYLEMATKGGNAWARHNLGAFKAENGDWTLAMRHWRILAASGCDYCLKHVTAGFREGLVSKDECAESLRAHQKVQHEAKSDERDRYVALTKGNT